MANFAPSDERAHPAGPHEHWNESFYLNFFDTEGNWGGASRIGFSPNRGYADGFVCLYFPNGATGFVRTWESCSDHQGRSAAGPIEHECIEPFQKWRLRYKGPIYYFEDPTQMGDFAQAVLTDLPRRDIELDLCFRPMHDVFDFHDSMKRELLPMRDLLARLHPRYSLNRPVAAMRKIRLIRSMSGAQHYEHAGRIEGTISVDGEVRAFEGFGQRDRSWGVRDKRVPANWRWFSGQFGDRLCFNAIKVEVLGLRASGGYVHHEGKVEALQDWALQAGLDASGRPSPQIALSLRSESGKRFEISGTTLQNIPVLETTDGCVTVVNEARTRFSWNGDVGWGISEFMEQVG